MSASSHARIRAALVVADYFAGGPDEMYEHEQAVVLQALEALRDAVRSGVPYSALVANGRCCR